MRAITTPFTKRPAASAWDSSASSFTSTGPMFISERGQGRHQQQEEGAPDLAEAGLGPLLEVGALHHQRDGDGQQTGQADGHTEGPGRVDADDQARQRAQHPDEAVGAEVGPVALEVTAARHAAPGQVPRQRTRQPEGQAHQQEELAVEEVLDGPARTR